MKKFIGIVLACIVLAGCGESYTKKQEMAIATVKASLKCPSTFSLVSISNERTMEEDVRYDTTFFYCKIFSSRTNYDSISVTKYVYPAHSYISVEYDAQNSFGAMVRNKAHVLFYPDDQMPTFEARRTEETFGKKIEK